MDYTTIYTDEDLIMLAESLEKREKSIAVDFEEECNLHVYGEHISIIQVFDGERFYIIDMLSGKVGKKGLERFFSSSIEKIWFECHSDLRILYNKYAVKAEHVYDLRVLAKALGNIHSLSDVKSQFLGREIEQGKKKNQMQNWMKRPLSDSMIDYALSDVKDLFALRVRLDELVDEKKKRKQVEDAMKSVARIKEQVPSWMKICNIRMLSRNEKIYLKNFFYARERVAERFNTPAVNVLKKKEIIRLAKKEIKNEGILEAELSSAPQRYRKFLIEEEKRALRKSLDEIERCQQEAR